jgi:hypothetical protein
MTSRTGNSSVNLWRRTQSAEIFESMDQDKLTSHMVTAIILLDWGVATRTKLWDGFDRFF